MESGDPSTMTQVESPRARRSAPSLEAQIPELTVAAAIDSSTLRRMQGFYTFGIVSGLFGAAVPWVIGGDKLAGTLFSVGLIVFALANVVIRTFAHTREQIEGPLLITTWCIAGVALSPSIYYFGPFSAVELVYLLAVQAVAIGRSRGAANAVIGSAIGLHLAIAIPIIAGWIRDVGLLSSGGLTRTQMIMIESLIIGILVSGFFIARWFRFTTREALDDLANARRMIDDQKQALAELNLDVARANRRNEGRWTGQKLGSWQLGLVLGRGGMGEVYEAVGTDGRAAAVKLLSARAEDSDSLIERFHREMVLAAKLSSPHIVQVYEVSPRDAPAPFIVMERLRGSDLATRLRLELRLSIGELTAMLEQVAHGLDVAHAAGVVHRDLKPHNLFSHGSEWKILDFGVAKIMGSEGTLTEGAIIGTPNYMAPEQAAGRPVTHLADIYSLGAIMYRCLTGRPPFGGSDVPGLLYQVVHMRPQRPTALSNVGRGVEDVLAIALAKDPQVRFQSARELAEEFARARKNAPLARPVPHDAWG